MKLYCWRPKWVVGPDSFAVMAENQEIAEQKIKEFMIKDDDYNDLEQSHFPSEYDPVIILEPHQVFTNSNQ